MNKQHVANWIQCNTPDLNWRPITGKGVCLRFHWNSTATSDCCAQNFGNDLWHDSEFIATKVCSQISCNWNYMFKSKVETWIAGTSCNFELNLFEQSATLIESNVVLTKICQNFQVLTSHFSQVNKLSVLRHNHWAKIVQREKLSKFNLISVQCNNMYW